MIQINRPKNCYSLVLERHTSFGAKEAEANWLNYGQQE